MNRILQKQKNILLLLLTALIWGFAFSAQKTGMAHMGPCAFNGIRSLIGAVFLIPCCLLLDKLKSPEERKRLGQSSRKTLVTGGLVCGLVLCAASTSQQIGVSYTSTGKAGFITAFYIIIVPIIGLFMKKRCSPLVWLSVVLALLGFYLLSITEEFTVCIGDLYVLACSFLFSLHILVVAYYSPKCDGVRLSCIQFFTTSVLCLTCMWLFEEIPSSAALCAGLVPLLYAGIMSCGIAYTLQILGQRDVNPTVASLIMSLESTFAALGGFLILDEDLSERQIWGCAVIFVAIILAQLPRDLLSFRRNKDKE